MARKRLSDAAFQRVFHALVSDARQYRDGQLGPDRIIQWNYYKGLVRAQPRRNRSRAVSTDVRDTVEAVHAQLMKMFGASGNIVSYEAVVPQAQRQAEIATEYIHWLFLRENRGWTILSDFFRDGLVADMGVLFHRAEEEEAVAEEEYTGLTESEADALASAPDVTVIERYEEIDEEAELQATVSDGDGSNEPEEAEDAQPPDTLPAGPQIAPPAGPAGPVGPISARTGAAQSLNGAPIPAPGQNPLAPLPGPSAGLPPDRVAHPGVAAGGPAVPQQTFYLRLCRVTSRTTIRVSTVPPDEFLIDPAATRPEDAKIMAIDCTRTVGEMTAAGYRYRDVLAYAGTDKSLTAERQARMPYTLRQRDTTITDDPTTYPLTVIQANVRIDTDGDGVPEIWRVTAFGEEFHVIHKERTDIWEFTPGSPYNVPHNVIGTGVARLVVDLQDIQTAILRNQLDSLYQAINPKYAAVEGQVNLDDATDESFARVVRIRSQGAYQPLQIPFVGQQAFPMIERLDKIREFRTGVSPEAAGLDADALQSSTEVGVRAVVGQSLLRIETIARNYVENAITDLFRVLLKLAIRYQDKAITFKTSGGFLTVDPSGFDPDMQVVPIVGLGNDSDQTRLGVLMAVKQTQEQVFQSQGPTNPLVGYGEYRNTLNDMLNLGPYKNTGRYFKPLPPNIDQIVQQQAAQNAQQQQQNPAVQAAQAQAQATMMRAQAQIQAGQQRAQSQQQIAQAKAGADAQRDQRKMQFEQWLAQQQMQLERMKADADIQLQRLKMMGDVQVDMAQIDAETQLERYKIAHQVGHPNAQVPNPDVRQ